MQPGFIDPYVKEKKRILTSSGGANFINIIMCVKINYLCPRVFANLEKKMCQGENVQNEIFSEFGRISKSLV